MKFIIYDRFLLCKQPIKILSSNYIENILFGKLKISRSSFMLTMRFGYTKPGNKRLEEIAKSVYPLLERGKGLEKIYPMVECNKLRGFHKIFRLGKMIDTEPTNILLLDKLQASTYFKNFIECEPVMDEEYYRDFVLTCMKTLKIMKQLPHSSLTRNFSAYVTANFYEDGRICNET